MPEAAALDASRGALPFLVVSTDPPAIASAIPNALRGFSLAIAKSRLRMSDVMGYVAGLLPMLCVSEHVVHESPPGLEINQALSWVIVSPRPFPESYCCRPAGRISWSPESHGARPEDSWPVDL